MPYPPMYDSEIRASITPQAQTTPQVVNSTQSKPTSYTTPPDPRVIAEEILRGQS